MRRTPIVSAATLAALAAGPLATAADKVERHVIGRFPDGVRIERVLIPGDELLGH